MKEKYLPNKKYYSFSTNCTCGVVVDEKTMKKIQKVLYKAESEIKNILHNSDDVRPYSWSLVNIMEGDKIKKHSLFHYFGLLKKFAIVFLAQLLLFFVKLPDCGNTRSGGVFNALARRSVNLDKLLDKVIHY